MDAAAVRQRKRNAAVIGDLSETALMVSTMVCAVMLALAPCFTHIIVKRCVCRH